MMTRTVVAFNNRTPVVLNAPPSTELQMTRAENAAAAAIAAKDLAVPAAAEADADRVAAQAALAATEAAQGIVTALLTGQGKPYANAYASTLPKGVTSVTIGGDPITGATVGEYAISGSGGSITGYSLTLVVTSATEAYVRVETNPDGSKATGLGSGTTPPTLTKPAGATLPAGTTLSAVVGSRIAVGEPYVVMSADGLEFLVYYNNAGAVAAFLDATSVQVAAPTSKGVAANSLHPGYADATAVEKAAMACVDALELEGVPAGKYVSWKYIFWKDAGTRFNATLVMHDDPSGTGAVDCCTYVLGSGADAWTTPQEIKLSPSSGSTVRGRFIFTPPAAALTMNGASTTAAMYQRRRVSRRTYRALTPNNSERVTTAARYSSALKAPPADGFVHDTHAEAALYDFRGIEFLPNFTLPTELYISKVSKRSSDNFFFAEISSVASGVVAWTGTSSGSVMNLTGINGYQEFKLWAFGTTTIAPIGTYLGTFAFEVPADGVASGSYNVAIASAKSALINSRIQMTAAQQSAITDLANTAIAATVFATPFPKTCTDAYLKRFVTKAKVEGGDVSERYLINYRTVYSALASPDKYFVNFQLYDIVTATIVATWNKQAPTDFTGAMSETILLTQAALGSALTNYAGITCKLWIDWAKIDWTKTFYTTYTTYAQAGIKPENVISNEEMDDFLVAPRIAKYVTFGNAQADYPTYAAAVQSIYKPDLVAAGQITRSTFPISDICSYSYQVAFVCVQAGYTETITPVTILGVDQSPIVLPPYSVTILLSDTVIQMTDAVKTAPVIEVPWSAMVIGGTFYQANGSGYVFHVDSGNELSKRSVVTNDDALCRFRQRRVWRNTVLKAGASACVNALVGAGVSNAAYNFWDGVGFLRDTTGSTGDFFFAHTSASATDPATDHFRNCWANDGQQASNSAAVSLQKSNSQTIKNRLIIENCDFAKVENSNIVGGASGWVRVGKIATGITYPSTLDPY